MTGEIDPVALLTIALALGVGGFVKGATGLGAPLVAVPIIAAFYDVTMGILVMVIPNIVMNAKQVWTYRANIRPARIALLMSLGSLPGMVMGTLLLSNAPQDALNLGLGIFLVAYLTLRLVDPRFSISERLAVRASLPTGIVGGIMQGVVGTSGPLALLFLSSQNLARPMFIGTISAFFLTNSVVQAPALWGEGLLTMHWLGISALALIPVWLCLPLGNSAAQRLSPEAFNRWVMVLLAALAVRLIWRGVA
jgi:uncharacterized membrane protein YfcA